MDMHPDNFSVLSPDQREIAIDIVRTIDGRDASDVINAMISIMAATINQSSNAAEVVEVCAVALINTAAAGRRGVLRKHDEVLQ